MLTILCAFNLCICKFFLQECERLMEENRRLKATAVLSSHLNIDHEQRAEVTLLQSKVNTLVWQLSQVSAF